jgi:hypothetical protein
MTTRSAGADGRRRKSAKARNRGRRSACGAARYGELSSRRMVTMADFGKVVVRADLGEGRRVSLGGPERGRSLACRWVCGRCEGREGDWDRRWPMTDVGDERLCCEECGGGHEVSIPIGVGADVGRYVGSQPRANISMTIIRPPQRGQGHGRTRGSSWAAGFCSSFSMMDGATPSSWRARAMLAVRLPLANKP